MNSTKSPGVLEPDELEAALRQVDAATIQLKQAQPPHLVLNNTIDVGVALSTLLQAKNGRMVVSRPIANDDQMVDPDASIPAAVIDYGQYRYRILS